jgi:hypothetical protein
MRLHREGYVDAKFWMAAFAASLLRYISFLASFLAETLRNAAVRKRVILHHFLLHFFADAGGIKQNLDFDTLCLELLCKAIGYECVSGYKVALTMRAL